MNLTNELLTDDFVLEGMWSIGFEFEESIPGKLTYSYSDSIIQVEFTHTNFNFEDIFKTFYGQISRTKIVTLFNARITSIKKNTFQYTKIVADSMVISPKPIVDLDNSLYREISFTYDNMDNWFQINPWKHDHINKTYYYEQPFLKKYNLKLINGVLEEKITPIESLKGIGVREINLFHIPYYKITFYEDKTIKHLHQIVHNISLLFTLFLGKKANIQFLDFPVETKDITGREMKSTGRYYVLQQQKKNNSFQLHPPYSYDFIAEGIEDYLHSFFYYFKKLKIIIQNFSVAFTGGSYVETSFLDASLNLEIFHREFFPENEVSKELNKAKEIIEIALEEIEKNLKEKILLRIMDAENTTLKKKIFELLKSLPKNLINELDLNGYNFNNSRGKGEFAMMCANTRNFITHGSSDTQSKIFPLSELTKVTRVLNLVSEYHIMHIIGLKDEDIFKGIIAKKYYHLVLKGFY